MKNLEIELFSLVTKTKTLLKFSVPTKLTKTYEVFLNEYNESLETEKNKIIKKNKNIGEDYLLKQSLFKAEEFIDKKILVKYCPVFNLLENEIFFIDKIFLQNNIKKINLKDNEFYKYIFINVL